MVTTISDVHVPLSGTILDFRQNDGQQSAAENNPLQKWKNSNHNGDNTTGSVTGFVKRSCEQYSSFSLMLVCDEALDVDHIDSGIAELTAVVEACADEGANASVTAGIDLYSVSAPEVIDRLKGVEEITGVRLMLNREVDATSVDSVVDGFLANKQWIENFALLGKANLLADVDVYPEQIPQLYYLLRDFPDVNVIIGQSGYPRNPDNGGDETWRNAMAMISSLDNVHIKLGGFHLFDPDWNCATVWPVVHHLLLCFGEDRVIFGSNCATDWSAGEYAAVIENLAAIMPSPDVADKVFHENADRLLGRKKLLRHGALEAAAHSHRPGGAA